MKKLIISAFIAVFLVACNGNSNKTESTDDFRTVIEIRNTASGILSPYADSLKLGTIKPGSVFDFQIGVKNVDTVAFAIDYIITSCGCISVVHDLAPIKPGETGILKVHYDSRGKQGFQNNLLQFRTTFGKRSFFDLAITADIADDK